MSTRIAWLHSLWQHLNEEEFGGKLKPTTLLLKRFRAKDGQMHGHNGVTYSIQIADRIIKDHDAVLGTMLHEMIHQYQSEVMKKIPDHDSTFKSIARHLERRYGLWVR